jgi:hypothetical protein
MVDVVALYVDGSGKSKPPIDTNASMIITSKKGRALSALYEA